MNLTFDDVLILPQFSNIASRKDVNTDTTIGQTKLSLGIISANMDTVTGAKMATAMGDYGSVGCLHRFQSIEDNVKMFLNSAPRTPWVSIGLGETELERATALVAAGAGTIVVDVAHGANMSVVNQVKALRKAINSSVDVIVGNFATQTSIKDFLYHYGAKDITALKVGVGSGSMCTTRVVTGCGVPLFSSVVDCSKAGLPIIADGGIRNSGDFAKALAAGASAVMVGRILAGADESLSAVNGSYVYRGSASMGSYVVQNKTSSWRTPEGEETHITATGPVANTLQTFDAGLRSAMSYVGASNIKEFQENAKFIQITNSGIIENGAHGK